VRRIGERFDRAEGRIVACEYAGTIGVPALFERSLFPELLALSGSTGAKPVLEAHPTDVVRLPWPDGAKDIDRPEDLQLLS
jgi:molybdenum cofactor cytidylyltransferase